MKNGLSLLAPLLLIGLAGNATASEFEFAPYATLPFNGFPRVVDVGDVNGDGRDDVVVGDNSVLSVYLQQPGGTLGAASEYGTSGTGIALEDLNGDGINDIVLAQGPLSILISDGAGGFTQAVLDLDFSDCYDLTILDVDLDDIPDIVCHAWTSRFATVYRGDGQGGIASQFDVTTFPEGSVLPYLMDITSGDVTGDGFPDLVLAVAHVSGIHVFAHDGVGGFGPGSTYLNPGFTPNTYTGMPGGLAIGDFNGDSLNDVAMTKYYSPSHVAVFLQASNGELQDPLRLDATDGAFTPMAVDLDRDGSEDLLVGSDQGVSRYLQVDGTLSDGIPATASFASSYADSFAAGDVNGDGCSDVVGVGGNDALHILHGICHAMPPTDFDADGRSDVFWRNNASGANVIWRGADYGNQQRVTGVRNLDWDVAGFGDFDADGKADVLWRNAATGANVMWKAADYRDQQAVTGVTNLDWVIAGTGDFDADGADDILWRDTATGTNAIWKSGNYRNQQPVAAMGDPQWQVAGADDFDADGADDILWRNSRTGANIVWLSGNAATPLDIVDVTGLAWAVAGTGDFNADGHADILWRNGTSGQDTIWLSGLQQGQRAVARVDDMTWQVAAVGDYDGDGFADILWHQSGTGANVVWRSADAGQPMDVMDVNNQDWRIMP